MWTARSGSTWNSGAQLSRCKGIISVRTVAKDESQNTLCGHHASEEEPMKRE